MNTLIRVTKTCYKNRNEKVCYFCRVLLLARDCLLERKRNFAVWYPFCLAAVPCGMYGLGSQSTKSCQCYFPCYSHCTFRVKSNCSGGGFLHIRRHLLFYETSRVKTKLSNLQERNKQSRKLPPVNCSDTFQTTKAFLQHIPQLFVQFSFSPFWIILAILALYLSSNSLDYARFVQYESFCSLLLSPLGQNFSPFINSSFCLSATNDVLVS